MSKIVSGVSVFTLGFSVNPNFKYSFQFWTNPARTPASIVTVLPPSSWTWVTLRMHSGRRNSFPLLTSYFDNAACADDSKKVRIEMEKMMEPMVEEDITNFTLAYSTNILLCNTKMQLLHGEKCGLLGGNSSGKTTLIWSIANNHVEDFSSSRTVGAVFVMVDIQRKQINMSCIEGVFIHEHI